LKLQYVPKGPEITIGQETIVEGEKKGVEEDVTREETATEITRIIEVETVETIAIGSALNAITRTSLLELNAIAVASQKVVAEGIEEDETKGARTKELIQTMTGFVANVKTQISHSERNVIAVVLPKVEAEVRAGNGKEMTAEPVIEEIHRNLGQEIGNAPSVGNPISPNGMTALDVDAQRELAVQRKGAIIAS
tara:strand:- start:3355 stop:3936 length:582 start_codon:yes stop_codon:yes gene_type:complete